MIVARAKTALTSAPTATRPPPKMKSANALAKTVAATTLQASATAPTATRPPLKMKSANALAKIATAANEQ